MTNTQNVALNNTIAEVKNYVDDPDNLYGVLRAGLLTSDLESPFVQFIGAKTMSYPSFPLNSSDLPNYSKTNGYARVDVNYERTEVTVSQDKGYQLAVDAEDLENGHLTSIAIINNQVRQMEIPSIDKYRLKTLASASGITTKSDVDLASQDAIDLYDTAIATLVDNEMPKEGTILYCTTDFYTNLKNSERIRRSMNVQANNGQVNREIIVLDGVTKIIEVPSTRMPDAKTKFILVQPKAQISGIKRSFSDVIEKPENFNGILINRRLVHDTFVLKDRAKGVYVGKTAA